MKHKFVDLTRHPILQVSRLLGIGTEKVVLLDSKTKALAKAQLTSDLQQWRTGGGRAHDR